MENLNLKLKDINDKKLEIRSKLETEENLDLDAVKAELDALEKEEKEIRSKLSTSLETKELKDIKEEKKFEVKNKMENKLDTIEYRQAFMNFAKTGEMAEEFRSVALASANSAVIPQPILNTIVEKLENFGNVLPLVNKTSYPAGFAIPTSQLTALATWTTEASVATTGIPVGDKVTGSITFSAYPLVKALGISFVAQIQTLSAFEAKLAENVATSMAKALEQAVVAGDGSGKPTGIFTEAATAATDVTLNATLKYKDLVNIKKAIPAAYRDGAVILTNESTFFELYSIEDQHGQPIARVNSDITGSPVYTILGTPVIVTDFAPEYSAAATGDIVAVVLQPRNYTLNMAYQPDMRVYTEDATRNKVYQSMLLADGKMVDKNGLVAIKKG